MRAIIFANGVLDSWPDHLKVSAENDLIIAADGGTAHCRRHAIVPHLVVGDLDSIGTDALARLRSKAVEIIRYPSRKDHTDLELALRTALERGAVQLIVLGALGMRWDMTLANVLILAADFLKGVDVRLLDGRHEITCLHGGQTASLQGQAGDTLSLLPLTETTAGVTLEGLEYPLQNAKIGLGATLGVSNTFTQARATVTLKQGLLLITVTRQKSGH